MAIPQFVALAERISGQELDEFFRIWLFTPSKPAGIDPAAARLAPLSAVGVGSERARMRGPVTVSAGRDR